MIESLRGRKFSNKCKHFVRCIRSRIEPIRKKKQAVIRYLKKDVADLVAGRHHAVAFGRIDALIVEINHTSCYDMIEKYCGCLLENLSTMRKERECPKEAMEAVATLIFAAARFSDLPELAELRLVFNERYETQINTCLNPEFVEKMQKKTFHKEKKLQLMQDISQEYSVSWNVKAFEDQILKSCQPEQSKKLLPAKDKAFSEILHEGTSYKEQLDASTKYEPHGSSVQRHQVRSEDQSDIHLNLKSDNIYSTDAIGTIKKQRSVNQRRELTRQNRFHHDSEDLQERELQNDPRKDSLMKITGASIASIVPNTARASEDLIVASGHVHPRLPDYDNLAARIATLSSSSA